MKMAIILILVGMVFVAGCADETIMIKKVCNNCTYNYSTYNTNITGAGFGLYYNKTPTLYTGNLGGYIGGDNICNATFSGSHMCQFAEIDYSRTHTDFASNPDWTGEAWVSTGNAKYSPAILPVNDCNGWTWGSSGSYLGNWWNFDQNIGKCGQCGNNIAVACCI
jgi:hypothetical protein